MSWPFLFFLVALILFLLAALKVTSSKIEIGWAGMFFLTLGFFWPSLPK